MTLGEEAVVTGGLVEGRAEGVQAAEGAGLLPMQAVAECVAGADLLAVLAEAGLESDWLTECCSSYWYIVCSMR